MSKKRSSAMGYLISLAINSRFLISCCVLLCILAMVRFHFQYKLQSTTPSFQSSSILRRHSQFQGSPKIAFLFLVRKDIPLDFVWDTFFKSSDLANFSIYVHSTPGFVFDETTTSSPFFYRRQLNNSIQVAWGESTIVEAERLLLAEALNDPANQRFVLLSDSCVPLYNFSYTYNYLMSSSKSFVDSFVNAKEHRYDPNMAPIIPKNKWRKGSQWITLIRRDAEIIVDDETIFPVFQRFCKALRPKTRNKGRKFPVFNIEFHLHWPFLFKRRNCIPDEHYVQTFLAVSDLYLQDEQLSQMSGLEVELERRTLTYTLWNQNASWHPVTFYYEDAVPEQLKEIKEMNYVFNKNEDRVEWCRSHARYSNCYLFARKFTRGAGMRLLQERLIGPYDVY